MKKKKKKPVKVRKLWGDLDPATKVIPNKRDNHNRAKRKRDWKRNSQQDWVDDDFE